MSWVSATDLFKDIHSDRVRDVWEKASYAARGPYGDQRAVVSLKPSQLRETEALIVLAAAEAALVHDFGQGQAQWRNARRVAEQLKLGTHLIEAPEPQYIGNFLDSDPFDDN